MVSGNDQLVGVGKAAQPSVELADLGNVTASTGSERTNDQSQSDLEYSISKLTASGRNLRTSQPSSDLFHYKYSLKPSQENELEVNYFVRKLIQFGAVFFRHRFSSIFPYLYKKRNIEVFGYLFLRTL